MMYQVQLVLKNRFGEFVGRKAMITAENYDALIKMSKTFYSSGGFELTCEDDSYAIFPPDIVKESVLIIHKSEVSDQSEQENIEEDVQE